jgi:hypothetical protein
MNTTVTVQSDIQSVGLTVDPPAKWNVSWVSGQDVIRGDSSFLWVSMPMDWKLVPDLAGTPMIDFTAKLVRLESGWRHNVNGGGDFFSVDPLNEIVTVPGGFQVEVV